MTRFEIALFLFTWIVLPLLAYWSYVPPSMMWTFLVMTILLDLSSFILKYITARIAARFADLKARIITRIFGE